jgi:anti-sigma regulatory factor (Ser/Thr protein kinase)
MMVELRYELQPSTDAPGAARRAIERELGGQVDPDALDSLMLVVSELVTNSVVHGPGRPILLELEVDRDGAIRGEVEDRGDGVVAIGREANADGPGGRGLRIVEALTDSWGVYEGSTNVWFELAP